MPNRDSGRSRFRVAPRPVTEEENVQEMETIPSLAENNHIIFDKDNTASEQQLIPAQTVAVRSSLRGTPFE